MRLIDKLKDALFDEDDLDDNEEEEIVKQVDVNKTINKEDHGFFKSRTKNNFDKYRVYDTTDDDFIKPFDFSGEEKTNTPAIFEEEDFISDTRELNFEEIPKKEEKILYKGNYDMKVEQRTKEKFKPSPVISPVYGVLERNYTVDKKSAKSSIKEINNSHIEKVKKEDELDIDTVRQKAFGIDEIKEVEDINKDEIIYDMGKESSPSINKVTLGDAEEYYDDLGLEYNVDYTVKDNKKEDILRKEVKEEKIESDDDSIEEKNLYDLIDLMYDGKDK